MSVTIRRFAARRSGRMVAAGMIALMTLQGCAQQVPISLAALNEEDECSVFRADIAEARRADWQEQATAAAIGAGLGALAGALIGGTRGAMIGLAGGALVGLGGSYLTIRSRNAADNEALLASVNADAGAEVELVTKAGRAAESLRRCRIDQLEALRTAVRDGAMDGEAARSELNLIQRRTEQENSVISAAFNGVDERVTAYVEATAEVARVDEAISEQEARRRTANVERASQTRTATLERDAAAAERIELLSAEIDALLG